MPGRKRKTVNRSRAFLAEIDLIDVALENLIFAGMKFK